MYDHVTGTLHSSHPHHIVVHVNGIGYRISIPLSAYADLPAVGKELTLHTSFVIRENLQALYGFMEARQRTLFETLISVSGVGPKLALAIIGHLSTERLQIAISEGNVAELSRVPGIGKRTAERLIVDLKTKLPNLFPRDPISKGGAHSNIREDAISALVNLGYSETVAVKAVEQAVESGAKELPQLISSALKGV